MQSIAAYPLCWPVGYPRNRSPKYGRFQTSFAKARDALLYEISLMKAAQVIISSNIPVRSDGYPYARYTEPSDSGIAVYFMLDGEQKVLCCDAWQHTQDNMQALRKTIEAMRGIGRWGCSDIEKRTFAGFKAISAGKSWWEVLGVSKTADYETVRAEYRNLASRYHPDKIGGDEEKMKELNQAWQEYLNSVELA